MLVNVSNIIFMLVVRFSFYSSFSLTAARTKKLFAHAAVKLKEE